MVAVDLNDVFEENLESDLAPVDNYRPVEYEVEAMAAFLLYDIKRLLARVPELTPGKLAQIAGLSSDWTIRDIRKPDWYVKNIATLFRLERALCSHPAWQPRRVYGTKSLMTPNGYMYRRWVDPLASPEFGEDTLVWGHRACDADFIDRMAKDPWSSTVDVSSGDPAQYRILQYSPAMISVYGIDKSGTLFLENPNPNYGRFVSRDLMDCYVSNDARSRDMFHSFQRLSDRIVFRNATWPCPQEGLVVSKLKVEYWRPNIDRRNLMPPRAPKDSLPALRSGSSS